MIDVNDNKSMRGNELYFILNTKGRTDLILSLAVLYHITELLTCHCVCLVLFITGCESG